MDEDRIVQHEVKKKVCDTFLYILSFATAFMFSKSIYEMFKLLTGDHPKKKGFWALLAFTVVIGAVTVVVTYFLVNRIKKEAVVIDKARAMQKRAEMEQLVRAIKHNSLN
jgi:Na+/melibiose symporter-like transporter